MLADLRSDLSILIPGEFIAGKRVVYPLALFHFKTHPAEVSAVFSSLTAPQLITDIIKQEIQPGSPVLITNSAGGRVVNIKSVSITVAGVALVEGVDYSHTIEQLADGFLQIETASGEAEITCTYEAAGGSPEMAAVAVARALMGAAFPLLSACCRPPLKDQTDPAAAAAAGSWAAQSIDETFIKPAERNGGGVPIAFRTVLARLVAAGHGTNDITSDVQTGIDGKPVPFRGWTLPQLQYYLKADDTRRARESADYSQAVAMAISACFGGDEGSAGYREYTEQLRAI